MTAEATASSDVQALFEANAATYDRVNTIISLGLDACWRDWVARAAVARPGAKVLDAFAGTGLVGVRAAELGASVTLADVSPGMLEHAQRRARSREVSVTTVVTDLTTGPTVPGGPFDAVTVVFGLRYLRDPAAVLAGLARLLEPGGRVVVLEFVTPGDSVVSRAAWVYFSRVLPAIGGALAGHRELYDELVRTTRELGGLERLRSLVTQAGLTVAQEKLMGFGLVAGLVATPAPVPDPVRGDP